jgi:aromatic-L-amino-acid decarboxylase
MTMRRAIRPLTSPPKLALLSFRYRPQGVRDEEALDTLNALNDDGRLYLTQNRLRGRYVIRFAIGQLYTTREHVLLAWGLVTETARKLSDLA